MKLEQVSANCYAVLNEKNLVCGANRQVEKTEGVTTMMIRHGWLLFLAMLASVLATPARAQDDQAAELAK
jgi:hypothetical protein